MAKNNGSKMGARGLFPSASGFTNGGSGRGKTNDGGRVGVISAASILIAVCVSFIARLLIYLINLVTAVAFYQDPLLQHVSPANNSLGIFVVMVPVVGGVVVGLMALYGSKAIRGHGIPEAMEQILTNQSKIKPSITYLKPVSSAIAIGTGGPFGAEGPIIATGGALGSTIGQILNISHHERKILLAAGATAGMSAIFGSPVAAVFLAIELLLFEFSPVTIIPVALACVTAAAGHRYLFGTGPVFAIGHVVEAPGNAALLIYGVIGSMIGLGAVGVTKIVYFIEDMFERLPAHWMWWPAIGGLFVGIIGYFSPRTLGVGYENITDVLSGSLTVQVVLSLCILKFASWAIALGSGTSGGTLAPLLTIGGAAGALLGSLVMFCFPGCGVTVSMSALVGMAAMFAGASRALLTSIIFALETTGAFGALLPLLVSCTASFFVSFSLMENTIMTEKIARRGIKTPDTYEQDILEHIRVEQVMKPTCTELHENTLIGEVHKTKNDVASASGHFMVVDDNHRLLGIVNGHALYSGQGDPTEGVGSLIDAKIPQVNATDTLKAALRTMTNAGTDVAAVRGTGDNRMGVVTQSDIFSAYRADMEKHQRSTPISLKRNLLKMWIRR